MMLIPTRIRNAARTATIPVLCAFASLSVALAEDSSFPPIPESQLKNGNESASRLQQLSDSGDGLATYYLGLHLACKPADASCAAQRQALLNKAIVQGSTFAIVSKRLLLLRADPLRATSERPSDAVCGQKFVDVSKLTAAISAIGVKDGLKGWKIVQVPGSLGSQLVIVANDELPKQVLLIYRGGDLEIARVFTIFLKMNKSELTDDQRNKLDVEVNERVAALICPQWKGLDQATTSYLRQLLVWPPRGVHLLGPGTWFAMMAVIPDIAWYDLYVDPCHNPFTSVLGERFGKAASPAGPDTSAYAECEQELWKSGP